MVMKLIFLCSGKLSEPNNETKLEYVKPSEDIPQNGWKTKENDHAYTVQPSPFLTIYTQRVAHGTIDVFKIDE